METDTALEEIGLSEGERKVYLALLRLGASTSGPIAREARISASKVYPVLDKLMKKGLVGVARKGRAKHFRACGPEQIIGYLEEKRRRIAQQEELIRRIAPLLMPQEASRTGAFLFEGVDSIKSIYHEIYETLGKGDEYIAFGIRGSDALRRANGFFQEWQVARGRKGIRGKIVYEHDARDLAASRLSAPHTQVRVLPKTFKTPAGINIYGKKTAIILWTDAPVVILIESEEVAASFKEYFRIVWQMAEPV